MHRQTFSKSVPERLLAPFNKAAWNFTTDFSLLLMQSQKPSLGEEAALHTATQHSSPHCLKGCFESSAATGPAMENHYDEAFI